MGRIGSGVEVREASIRLAFTTADGERHRCTLMLNGAPMAPTVANVKFAHKTAAEIKERIRHGTFSMAEYFPVSGAGPSTLTVAAQLDTWRGTLRLEASTIAGYESAIRFWKSAPYYDSKDATRLVGDRALRALTLTDIKTALASRPALSGKTVNNYVSCLREALALAVPDVLPTNPADKVPRAAHQKEPPDPFTREQAEAIIARVQVRYPGQVANLVEFWMFSGLRTSELFALRWETIDWTLRLAQVKRALVRGVLKDTKTSTVRDVALNSRALAALQAQKAHTFMAAHGFVWEDPRYREPWNDERAFRRSYWAPTLKAVGIRYRRPYHCRHTFATMLLMAGARPAYAARQLGHSVEVFHANYARWLNDGHADLEQQRLEAFIGSNVPGTSPKSETGT